MLVHRDTECVIMGEDLFSMYGSNGFHFYRTFCWLKWRLLASLLESQVAWNYDPAALPKKKEKCFGAQLHRLGVYAVKFYIQGDCLQLKSANIKHSVHTYTANSIYGNRL